jgi:hypothetical protein
LRDCIGTISFGATVVGKMHTAGLKGEPLATIQTKTRKEWLETLDRAFEAQRRALPGDEHLEGVAVGNFRFTGKFTGP